MKRTTEDRSTQRKCNTKKRKCQKLVVHQTTEEQERERTLVAWLCFLSIIVHSRKVTVFVWLVSVVIGFVTYSIM